MALDCCLICFQVSGNELWRESEEKMEIFQRFFKLLKRHLNNNGKQCDVIDEISKIVKSLTDFGVPPACEECLELMNSFCELYHKINVLELLLNHKMRTLTSTMFWARKVPARVDCFKVFLASRLQLATSGLSIDELINGVLQSKNRLIGICSQKLTETYPLLILERVSTKNNVQNANQLSSSLPTISYFSVATTVGTDRSLESEKISAENPVAPCDNNEDCFDDIQPALSPPAPVSNFESSDLSCEDYIDISVTSKTAPNQQVLLKSENHEMVSYEQPSMLKKENLINSFEDVNPQRISETETSAPSPRRSLRTIRKCAKCERTFSSGDKLNQHETSGSCCGEGHDDQINSDGEDEGDEDNFSLTSKNETRESEEVELDVDKGDMKPSIESLSPKKERKLFNWKSNECPVCHKEVPTLNSTAEDSITKHVLQEHPEAFQTASGIIERFSCPIFYCPCGFDSIDSVTNHCADKHKPEFKLRMKLEEKDRLLSDLDDPLRCPFTNCEALCLNRAVLTIHLKAKHKSKWNAGKLTSLSRKFFKARMKSLGKVGSEVDFEESKDKKKPRKLKPANTYKFQTKCPDCSQRFTGFCSMISHRMEAHLNNEDANKDLTVEILQPFENKVEVCAKIEIKSSKVFSCPEGKPACGQLFLFEEDLHSHRKLHGDFKCNFCDFKENYAIKLAEHELKKHTKPDTLISKHRNSEISQCPRCEEKFPRNYRYRYFTHFLTQHLELPKLMEQCCPICRDPHEIQAWFEIDAIYEYKHLIDQHNLLKDVQVHRCEDKDCSAYFLTLNQIRKHFRLVHSFQKDVRWILRNYRNRVECKDCGQFLHSKCELKSHRLAFHVKDEDKIRCTVDGCQKEFELEKELQTHLKFVHEQVCPKCGKDVTGKGGFKRHLAAHENEGKAKEKKFCEICGKGFKTRETLKSHILMRHKGPESFKFECKVCAKKCFTKAKLDEHLRTHTKEKPFVCQVCGAAYGHRHNLRLHVNSKHGDVMQDIPQKIDTSNMFRRKEEVTAESKGKASKNGRKRKRVDDSEISESDSD